MPITTAEAGNEATSWAELIRKRSSPRKLFAICCSKRCQLTSADPEPLAQVSHSPSAPSVSVTVNFDETFAASRHVRRPNSLLGFFLVCQRSPVWERTRHDVRVISEVLSHYRGHQAYEESRPEQVTPHAYVHKMRCPDGVR